MKSSPTMRYITTVSEVDAPTERVRAPVTSSEVFNYELRPYLRMTCRAHCEASPSTTSNRAQNWDEASSCCYSANPSSTPNIRPRLTRPKDIGTQRG